MVVAAAADSRMGRWVVEGRSAEGQFAEERVVVVEGWLTQGWLVRGLGAGNRLVVDSLADHLVGDRIADDLPVERWPQKKCVHSFHPL